MHTVDGLTFISILNLNMGFWTILLDKESQLLATVILPWGKYSYQCLAMGLSIRTLKENLPNPHVDPTN
jgi:hypothetical protein